jgi:hypothetical protein
MPTVIPSSIDNNPPAKRVFFRATTENAHANNMQQSCAPEIIIDEQATSVQRVVAPKLRQAKLDLFASFAYKPAKLRDTVL